jgi:hypothetical protein
MRSNGRILAIGGLDTGASFQSEVDSYDVGGDAWTAGPSLPTARGEFPCATLPDGRIFAMGANTTYVFTSSTGKWTTKAGFPTPRSAAGGAASGGRIYAIGGWDGTNTLATVEAYDPNADAWSKVASMPTARDSLVTVTASDGRIFAIGGDGLHGNPTTKVEVYTP